MQILVEAVVVEEEGHIAMLHRRVLKLIAFNAEVHGYELLECPAPYLGCTYKGAYFLFAHNLD